jgi:hypothetical protein
MKESVNKIILPGRNSSMDISGAFTWIIRRNYWLRRGNEHVL